ncbi:hypothetical protein Tco_1454792, partial [Tanacetum coccineum]
MRTDLVMHANCLMKCLNEGKSLKLLEQEEYSTGHIETSEFLRGVWDLLIFKQVRQHWQVSMGFVVRRKGSTIDEERVKDFVTN